MLLSLLRPRPTLISLFLLRLHLILVVSLPPATSTEETIGISTDAGENVARDREAGVLVAAAAIVTIDTPALGLVRRALVIRVGGVIHLEAAAGSGEGKNIEEESRPLDPDRREAELQLPIAAVALGAVAVAPHSARGDRHQPIAAARATGVLRAAAVPRDRGTRRNAEEATRRRRRRKRKAEAGAATEARRATKRQASRKRQMARKLPWTRQILPKRRSSKV
jgi:hypothetical protein